MNVFFKDGKTTIWRRVVVASCIALALAGGNLAGQEEFAPTGTGATAGGGEARATTETDEKIPHGERPQITVKTPDLAIRASFKTTAEQVNTDFRRVLKLPPRKWVIPIQIILHGKPSDIITKRDLQTKVKIAPDGSFILVLHCRLHELFTAENFEREMLRVLLLHEMLRPHSENSSTLKGKEIFVPQWLITGFHEHLLFRKRGARNKVFGGILEEGNIMRVEEILKMDNISKLTPMGRAVFEASAAALVSTLLEQKGGKDGFQAMLISFTADKTAGKGDPAARLRQHFPAMRENPVALGKWWTLQLAALGEMTAYDYYTVVETQRLLDQALFVQVRGKLVGDKKRGVLNKWIAQGNNHKEDDKPKRVSLSEFQKLMERDDLAHVLGPNGIAIKEVQIRGFPLYRDLADRFEILFHKMLSGNKIGIAAELKALEKQRNDIDFTMERVNDFMNHYQATQAPSEVDSFDDYRIMRERLERESAPKRDDRISKHLDELEKEFE